MTGEPLERRHVVYVSYDGAGEPLGRSQVLAYLRGLAADHRITLISFEKDGTDVATLGAELAAHGIEWVALRYHRRPPVLSTALDVLRGQRALARLVRDEPPDIVHVRSDVAALIAYLARRRTRAPMLFDIRGFWADERVEGGLWPRDGALYRLARSCEQRFYKHAAAVVTLTEASVDRIRAQTGDREIPVEVIPTCVDHAPYAASMPRAGGPHAVWSGSIGTWYRFDLAPRLAAVLEMPLTVLTRQVEDARAALGDVPAEVRTVAAGAMPAELHAGDVGLCLILSSPSKQASAPTRFAEYLAAGMPVAVTPGVGDLDALVEAHEIGVVLRGEDDKALREAAARLRALAADPAARARCRQLAKERFDLAAGTRDYAEIYRRLTPGFGLADGECELAWCPLCTSRQISPLRGYEAAHLRRCRECGLVFAGRRPSTEQIRRQYDGYGVGVAESAVTRARYEELLDEFEAYRRTGRILDIGCGEGGFLQAAAERGWEVHGTESTEGALARNRARGIAMTLAPVRPGDLPPATFDVVTAFEVVEHLGDPRAEASIIAGTIRDGGLLYVTTPNFASASRRLLGPSWTVIGYPEHLCYFTAATLTRCMEDAGFDALRVTSSGVSLGRLIRGLRRQRGGDPPAPAGVAPTDERLREGIERSTGLRVVKRVTNAILGATQTGDTLKGRFRRRSR
ncbi:MAG TPA: methyltransferase domain-containing protein [Solirubrobacteraceae bacterium]|jgi:glycosyltransferase involved in cell wall biosynthesis|nr:methyltransferase domain-containing protein [Solirubrobacteraceae bacterium]